MSSKGLLKSGKAFTLLELLVVLFLMALASSLAIPRLGSLLPQPPRDFPSRIKLFLETARQRAVLEGQAYLVVIDPEKRRFCLKKALSSGKTFPQTEEAVPIPEEIEIRGKDLLSILKKEKGILFFPEGISSGGEIEFIFYDTGSRYLIRIARLGDFIMHQALH